MEAKITYRQARDISAVFSAAFGFGKQNFRAFFGSLFLLAGPLILAGTLLSSYLLRSDFLATLKYNDSFKYMSMLVNWSVILLAVSVGISIYNVALNRSLIVNENLPAEEKLSLSHIRHGFMHDYWHVLLNFILFFLSMLVFIVILVFVMMGVFSFLNGWGPLTATFAVLLTLVFFIVLVPVLAYMPVAAFFVCQRDRIHIFAATGKVFFYMRHNFWRTWALSTLALIAYSLMATIAQVPLFILGFISAMSRSGASAQDGTNTVSILLVIATAICTLLSYGVMAFYYLMSIFHFTSLEEKKEGTAVLDRINQVV